ncbi:MAG: type II toxin-antitoxin system VapC family toxin [Chitinivibrionia bacterium]|nr:type II toxin-antitoxin system VapC family toxin [Chitinivibrionia bacterium]
MKKKSVYVETTIPSLVTARPSRDFREAFRQNVAKYFWENERHKYDLYISRFVLEECEKGDAEAAKRRIDLMKDIQLLSVTIETEKLAEEYFEYLNIPQKAKTDCFHLAVCVENEVDFLISWNLTHLGRPTYKKIVSFNENRKLWLPELLTPDVFMEVMEEEKKERKNGKV